MNRLRPGFAIGSAVLATASITLAVQLATSFKTPPPRPTVVAPNDPYANDPYANDPYADDPYANDPYGASK